MRLSVQTMNLRLEGVTPLVTNSCIMTMPPEMVCLHPPPLPVKRRTTEDRYNEARYRTQGGADAIPAVSIKKRMVRAARNKQRIKQCVHVECANASLDAQRAAKRIGGRPSPHYTMVPIWSGYDVYCDDNPPRMRMEMVRFCKRGPLGEAPTPEYDPWFVDIAVKYVHVESDEVRRLLEAVGHTVGLGSVHPGCGRMHHRYAVSNFGVWGAFVVRDRQ